jgi:hypothetical protein
VANTMANSFCCCCCCDFSYHWEQLASTNAATSCILNSVLTVLGRPVCSSSSKMSPPCAKHLCLLNTALWP